MIIRLTRSESAHAIADVLESVGIPCEVYPVDVCTARPWWVDLSDRVEQARRDELRESAREMWREQFSRPYTHEDIET